MKIIEYKAKGYNGKKVNVPAKYAKVAKGLVKDVLRLQNEDELPKMLGKQGYGEYMNVYGSAKELLSYNITYNESNGPASKAKLQELKDNLYLRVCLQGASDINLKKTRKIKKKSEEEILRINKEHKKITEKIQKMLRDD
jgi:hypothetical protein